MAESRIRNVLSRSTFLTVGRLVVFVAAGFAVGLVIGIASEEPSLLVGYFRGDPSTVELDAALAARPDQDAEAAALAAAEAASEAAAEDAAEAAAEDALEVLEFARDEGSAMALPDVGAGPVDAEPGWISGAQARAGASRVDASPASDRWAIQVGAFADQPSAAQLASRLEGKGYPIEVLPADAGSSRWRVRVQPIDGETQARTLAERVEREERLPIWVIRIEGSARP